MAITSITTNLVGEQNVNPRLVRITTDDVLATVTSLNWLKPVEAQGYYILPTDFLAISYSGGAGWFNPSIDLNGNITLSVDVPAGGVTVTGTPTTGHVATFSGASSIQDGGALGQAAFKAVSDNTKASVSSVSGTPVTVGNVVSFADVNGTIQNGGVAVSALQRSANIVAGQRSFAGGATTFDIGNALFTTSSIPIVNFISYTTPQTILFVTPGTSQFTVTFSGDPGASVLAFTCFVAPQ